jgi:hypothetical protein
MKPSPPRVTLGRPRDLDQRPTTRSSTRPARARDRMTCTIETALARPLRLLRRGGRARVGCRRSVRLVGVALGVGGHRHARPYDSGWEAARKSRSAPTAFTGDHTRSTGDRDTPLTTVPTARYAAAPRSTRVRVFVSTSSGEAAMVATDPRTNEDTALATRSPADRRPGCPPPQAPAPQGAPAASPSWNSAAPPRTAPPALPASRAVSTSPP